MTENPENPSIIPALSLFWALLLVILALLLWFGVQDYQINSQRLAYNRQWREAQPSLAEAQNIKKHYTGLLKDLIETSQKDAAAKAIVDAAVRGGMIEMRNTGKPASAPAPAPAP
jgi:hypothetical protein